jgi:hypothetical protein
VIFLLSTDITGSGEFEMASDEILRRLNTLNPLDPETGRRLTRIQCVQFLDPDPLDTLKRIAREHAGGSPPMNAAPQIDGAPGSGEPTGFRFLSREQLGLTPTNETAPPVN